VICPIRSKEIMIMAPFENLARKRSLKRIAISSERKAFDKTNRNQRRSSGFGFHFSDKRFLEFPQGRAIAFCWIRKGSIPGEQYALFGNGEQWLNVIVKTKYGYTPVVECIGMIGTFLWLNTLGW
jgi:hypothetical protein